MLQLGSLRVRCAFPVLNARIDTSFWVLQVEVAWADLRLGGVRLLQR
jgi:hypothetical protein